MITLIRRRSLLAALCAVVLMARSGAAALAPGDYPRTLAFGGQTRDYRIHVPPGYTGSSPVPLVFDFHGLGSNAGQQEGLSGQNRVADEHGYVVVHPNGLNNAWNAGICCGNRDVDDVGFIRAMVTAVGGEINVDARRVYTTGLSNGGAISQYLACQAADLFAASVPMAFPITFWNLSECHPARSIPVLTVLGLTDHLVTYDHGPFPTAAATFAYWHDIDGCTGTTPDETVTHGQSRCETYTHCDNGVQAGLCSVVARSFPGLSIDGHILYLQNDFDLAEVAWSFMSQFTLPDDVPVPATTKLTGKSVLKLAGRMREPLAWTLTLGTGTWGATVAEGVDISGSAVPVKHKHRVLALTLTADSRVALAKAVAARVAAVRHEADVTLAAGDDERLLLTTDRHGKPIRLTGRVQLAQGSTIGQYQISAGRRSRVTTVRYQTNAGR